MRQRAWNLRGAVRLTPRREKGSSSTMGPEALAGTGPPTTRTTHGCRRSTRSRPNSVRDRARHVRARAEAADSMESVNGSIGIGAPARVRRGAEPPSGVARERSGSWCPRRLRVPGVRMGVSVVHPGSGAPGTSGPPGASGTSGHVADLSDEDVRTGVRRKNGTTHRANVSPGRSGDDRFSPRLASRTPGREVPRSSPLGPARDRGNSSLGDPVTAYQCGSTNTRAMAVT